MVSARDKSAGLPIWTREVPGPTDYKSHAQSL